MAIAAGDLSVAANGDIREVAGTTTHEVIELHEFLMGKLDDAESTGDDLVAVDNAIIPSIRRTDNIIELQPPYNITTTEMQRFFNGSISQNDGDDLFSGLEVVGAVGSTTTLLLVQDTNNDATPTLITNFWGDTTSALYADTANNVLLRCLIQSRAAGADLDGKRLRIIAHELGDTFDDFPVTLGTGITTGAISTQDDTFNNTAAGTIAGWDGNISNLNEGYVSLDIDGNSVNENYASQIDKGTQSQGDVYEWGKWQQRRGSSETIYGLDAVLFRGITHEADLDAGSGTFAGPELLTWAAGSGQLIAVDNNTASSATKVWFQLLTGAAPADNDVLTGATSGATVTCDFTGGSLTSRNVNKNCWLGNYTGAWIGAYGIGWQEADVVAADAFTALDGTSRNPPNNVALVATGLVSGDIIFAAKTKTHTTTASGAHSIGDTTLNVASGVPADYDVVGRIVIDGTEHVFTAYSGTTVTIAGSGLKVALTGGEDVTVTQFYNDEFTTDTPAGTYNGTGDSEVKFTGSIGSGFPSAGKVRIWDGVDRYDEYSYTGISGDTLTGITPTLSQDYNGEAAYIPYVSESASGSTLSKTVVHTSDVAGRWRLYNAAGAIVPFEVGFNITSGGSTTQLIRNSDA